MLVTHTSNLFSSVEHFLLKYEAVNKTNISFKINKNINFLWSCRRIFLKRRGCLTGFWEDFGYDKGKPMNWLKGLPDEKQKGAICQCLDPDRKPEQWVAGRACWWEECEWGDLCLGFMVTYDTLLIPKWPSRGCIWKHEPEHLVLKQSWWHQLLGSQREEMSLYVLSMSTENKSKEMEELKKQEIWGMLGKGWWKVW